MNEKFEKESKLANGLMDWIEDVTNERIEDLWVDTKSGRTLCRLLNKLHPGIIKKVNQGKQKMMELVSLALSHF